MHNSHNNDTQHIITCNLHTLMVTFPFVIVRMLNPTVGIMSSLNCPDYLQKHSNNMLIGC